MVPSTKIRANTSLGAMSLTSPKISLLEGDVADFDFLQKLFAEYEFDTVFHLGAMSEVRKCQANSKLAFDVNIGGTVSPSTIRKSPSLRLPINIWIRRRSLGTRAGPLPSRSPMALGIPSPKPKPREGSSLRLRLRAR